jgi:hypothetical protein
MVTVLALVITVQLLLLTVLIVSVWQLLGVHHHAYTSGTRLLQQLSPSGLYGLPVVAAQAQLAGVSQGCNKPLPWGVWLVTFLMTILPNSFTQWRLVKQALTLLKPIAPVLLKKIYS